MQWSMANVGFRVHAALGLDRATVGEFMITPLTMIMFSSNKNIVQ